MVLLFEKVYCTLHTAHCTLHTAHSGGPPAGGEDLVLFQEDAGLEELQGPKPG